ncbi:MAG: hypothetical protein LBQ47_05960 [Endomicrobium sp.]|jgi:hypothetical protein|nr:hypothetical protein [Endomicrobium sp.]
MIKIVLPVFILCFALNAFAAEIVKISRIDSSVIVKIPSGESKIYKSAGDMPSFIYGSRITSVKGIAVIKIFNTAEVFLEKGQGVFITKNPITNAVEIMKLDSSAKNPLIKIILADKVNAFFGSDTRIALLEQFPSVNLEVKRGRATVKGTEGKTYNLSRGDRYEAKKNLIE